jgi:beta-galactosidase
LFVRYDLHLAIGPSRLSFVRSIDPSDAGKICNKKVREEMIRWSRRDVLKSGAAIPAASLLGSVPISTLAQTMAHPPEAQATVRERLLLDFGWRFHMGHAGDPTKDFGFSNGRSREFQKTGNFLPPAALAYDDSGWRDLDLPHDWVIELPFKNDPSLSSKGFYPIGRSYPENSVGWYRKVFEIPIADKGKRITVEFDGVYREALVAFNGFYIGQHRGGYDPFSFDLTDFVNPGAPNVLLVRVDATLSDGWFYEGAGIYRHVWLTKTGPVHVKKWGTFVRSAMQGSTAYLKIRTEVENHAGKSQSVRITSSIVDPAGKRVARSTSLPAVMHDADEHTYEQQVTVAKAELWSLEERNLYRLVTEVEANGQITDRYETQFGIRTLRFDADKGFFLNGKSVKVKGTCNHQDHAGLGVALPDAAQAYRIRTLQGMGCNAYRSSHNPPTPELLDVCDELGMLVLDETRMMSSNDEGIAQFEDLIRRDRNHPSVFMWSMGNEERESTTEVGLRILTSMKKVATQLDGSRPVTVAPQPLGLGLGQGGLTVSDVMGYNYADPQIEAYHQQHPSIPAMGTENVSAVATRGIYKIDPTKGYVSSYDPYTTTGRASGEGWWRFVSAREWMAGGFIWTGFDYRGEPSPYQWPNISSQYGVIDTCGFPKDTYFYFQSWWTEKPVLHVFPHWNWAGLEGKEIAVWVHSNLDRVELFQNGKSLGVKDVPKESHLQWIVPFEPGVLEARGVKDGQQVLVTKRETTGKAAKLTIRADRRTISADGEDLAFFTVEVLDEEGRVVPIADNEVTFAASGAGRMKGVGNGDPTSHESDIGLKRRAFSGLCMAIVQAGRDAGEIHVEASSPGLASATAVIHANPTALRPQLAAWNRPVPSGAGVTGLWRPTMQVEQGGPEALQLNVTGDTLYTFIQNGASLTGTLEAPSPGIGPAASGSIEAGKIEGNDISFRVGTATYTGTIQGDHIELHRTGPARGASSRSSTPTNAPPLAIGPPPDGSDPSLGNRAGGPQAPIVLKRAAR